MLVNEDFKFRDDLSTENDTIPIEILNGPYAGVVYRYTQVSVKETEDNNAVLQFGYDLLENESTIDEKKLRSDELFTNYIGLVLNTLILESVENEIRDGNTEELVEE